MNDKQTYTREVAQEIFITMPFLMKVISAELRQANSSLGITHLAVLNILMEKPCNLSELAEFNAVSLPTMSGTVSKLVRDGFVHRTRSKTDRRMIVVEITVDGQKLIEKLGEQLISRVADLLSGNSNSELGEIKSGLGHLQHAFSK
ncbi:MAG: MarR family transcriptional regulator [Chloroflexi bacterium]|nr:MarR family transcriptional regulator [Chloroflexota bacterium]